MTWNRLGKIITQGGSSYYAKPLLIATNEGYKVIYTDRDNDNCSQIKVGSFTFSEGAYHVSNEKLVYSKDLSSPLEANGVMAMDYIQEGDSLFLFCTAFHFDQERQFLSSPLMLTIDRKSYELVDKMPINITGENQHIGCGGVIAHNDERYLVFESRFMSEEGASFKLKLAKSKDLKNWDVVDSFLISPSHEENYISSPSLLKQSDKFLLCYSSKKNHRYYIRFKESNDLINWKDRPDMDFTPSSQHSWENEETCYPYIFHDQEHNLSMLYNGNKYGKTGIGYSSWT